jgi:aminopeptidase N
LNDSYYGLRILAIDKIDISNKNAKTALKIIEKLAINDDKTLVQAKAISKLKILENPKYATIFKNALQSKSNSVKGSAISALYKIDQEAAMSFVNSINDKDDIESMKDALIPLYIMNRTEEQMPLVAKNLIVGMFITEDKAVRNMYKEGFQWVASSDNEKASHNLVDSFVEVGIKYKEYGYDRLAIQVLQQVLELKTESNYPNKENLIKIVQDAQELMK